MSAALPKSSSAAELSAPVVAFGAGALPVTAGMVIVEGEDVSLGASGVTALTVEVGGAACVAVALGTAVIVAVGDSKISGVLLGASVAGMAVAAINVGVDVAGGTGVMVAPPGGVTTMGVSVGPGLGGLSVFVADGIRVREGVGSDGVTVGTVCASELPAGDAQTAGRAKLAATTSAMNNRLPHHAQDLIRIIPLQPACGRLLLSAITYLYVHIGVER
jgi:hypothetical protein